MSESQSMASSSAPIVDIPAQLRRFCALFSELSGSLTIEQLTIDHFERWKPELSRRAGNLAPESAELADLVVVLGSATGQWACHALSWWTRGNILHHLDYPLLALEALDRATEIYASHAAHLPIAQLAGTRVGILERLGRGAEGVECGLAALPLLRASNTLLDRRRIAIVTMNVGVCYVSIGQYVEALDHYQEALAFWCGEGNDQVEVALVLNATGVARGLLGLFAEAQEAFQEARPLFVAHKERVHVARVDLNLAWIALLRKDSDANIAAAFAQAHASRDLADPKATSTDLIILDLFEIDWLIKAGHIEQAHQKQAGLMARCAANGIAAERAIAEIFTARLRMSDGDANEATTMLTAVSTSPEAATNDRVAFLAPFFLAQAHARAGRNNDAETVLMTLVERIEQQRGRLAVDDYMAGYLEDKLAAYHALARLRMARRDDVGAHEVVERAKSRTLVDWLDMEMAARPESADLSVSQAITMLRKTVESPASSEHERHVAERQLVEMQRQTMRSTARVTKRSVGAPTASVETIAAQLADDELAVSYAVIEAHTWAFLLSASGLLSQPIDLGPAPTDDEMRAGLARISQSAWPTQFVKGVPDLTDSRTRSAQKVLGNWHEQFILPMERRVDFSHFRRLIVSFDGMLNSLPIAGLFNRASGKYLVETHEVIQTPSLTAWTLIPPAANVERLVSAPLSALSVGHSAHGWLSGAVEEAMSIATILPGTTVLLEAQATQQALLHSAEKASLIFIAAHGQFRRDVPQLSFIALADGNLHAFDIANVNLKQSRPIVVLSACESGLGHLTGNEMMGLVRAFLVAGARAVVAPHWRIDDAAALRLVTCLARHLTHCEVSRALQWAQTEMLCLRNSADADGSLRRLAHPFFWCGWSVFGRS